MFCQESVYLEGFCKFHYAALQNGEINECGIINEQLSDQIRRREINFYGMRFPDEVYLEDRK